MAVHRIYKMPNLFTGAYACGAHLIEAVLKKIITSVFM
jgi:hypothetical protein